MEKTIKKAMVEKGREDFNRYLAEILGCSIQWATKKMKLLNFTLEEATKISNELDIPFEEFKGD